MTHFSNLNWFHPLSILPALPPARLTVLRYVQSRTYTYVLYSILHGSSPGPHPSFSFICLVETPVSKNARQLYHKWQVLGFWGSCLPWQIRNLPIPRKWQHLNNPQCGFGTAASTFLQYLWFNEREETSKKTQILTLPAYLMSQGLLFHSPQVLELGWN